MSEAALLSPWDERPQDVSNLLNPSYIGTLLFRAVVGYSAESDHGMPYSLLFLVPPFVLHEATRNRLPATAVTTLPTWLQDHKDVVVDFGNRSSTLVPFTREAVMFLLEQNVITIDDEGNIRQGEAKPKGVTKYQQISETVKQSYRRSEFVGKWLARSGSPMTIFALMGVTP